MSATHIGTQPSYVYGDSTPFEPGFDFIATVRASVECCVTLMQAQHAVDCARARVAEAGEHLVRTRCELASMAQAIDGALRSVTPEQPETRDVSQRVSALARNAMTTEARRTQNVLDAVVIRADTTIGEARRAAVAAIGQLASRQELPGALHGFRVFATEDHYGAESLVALPCGLRLTFDAALPEDHPMRAPCKVRSVADGVIVTIPHTVGWFRRRVEPTAVCLDGLTILGASAEGQRGALLLGDGARSGVSHAFDMDFSAATPRVRWRDAEDEQSFDLGVHDAAAVARLLRAVERRAGQVPSVKRTLCEAMLDDRQLAEHDPADACARIVGLIAPMAREIARRSGAPGELVLRRNLGAGHRDEVFVTTEELQQMIQTLPPSLRRVFAPLGLEGRPVSRRAPPRRRPSYEELSASEFLSVS